MKSDRRHSVLSGWRTRTASLLLTLSPTTTAFSTPIASHHPSCWIVIIWCNCATANCQLLANKEESSLGLSKCSDAGVVVAGAEGGAFHPAL